MILMIKVVDDLGIAWNIQLSHVVAVEFNNTNAGAELNLNKERMYLSTGVVVDLATGTWQTVLNNLVTEYNANPKASDHLIIGST